MEQDQKGKTEHASELGQAYGLQMMEAFTNSKQFLMNTQKE